MRRTIIFCFALALIAAPVDTFAQQDAKTAESAAHYYRLTYSVQEVGETGKVANSRIYTADIATGVGSPVQIRTGDKVPLVTDNKENLQYLDVGVNIDCNHAQEVDGKLALQIAAEISSLTKGSEPTPAPIIRSNKWSANVLVPIAKPTIIFSSDNLQDKGRIQVEMTATRID